MVRCAARRRVGRRPPGALLIFIIIELEYNQRSNLRGAAPQISLVLQSRTASADRALRFLAAANDIATGDVPCPPRCSRHPLSALIRNPTG
jgi:hypothetical protein